jgi:hypothetical protein
MYIDAERKCCQGRVIIRMTGCKPDGILDAVMGMPFIFDNSTHLSSGGTVALSEARLPEFV